MQKNTDSRFQKIMFKAVFLISKLITIGFIYKVISIRKLHKICIIVQFFIFSVMVNYLLENTVKIDVLKRFFGHDSPEMIITSEQSIIIKNIYHL